MKEYVYEIISSSPMPPEMLYKNLKYDNEVRIRHVTKIRALIDKERRAKSGNKQSMPLLCPGEACINKNVACCNCVRAGVYPTDNMQL